jgi:hypothetical protein
MDELWSDPMTSFKRSRRPTRRQSVALFPTAEILTIKAPNSADEYVHIMKRIRQQAKRLYKACIP